LSTIEFNVDAFLSDLESERLSSEGSDTDGTEESTGAVGGFREQGYEGTIDYRIRQLSYSSLLTLHSCPRKFQLYRLRTTHRTEESLKSTITFAYGHIVGEAIQLALTGASEDEIIWKMYLGWHTDLLAVDEKLKKSFWTAVLALQKFLQLRSQGFLNDYELVYHNGSPACELSFVVNFPGGFRLRGFVDAVLRHKDTGEILVLELKTTGAAAINPATYKNSAQAIGYSIVLDSLFPELSSYTVLYLVYQTKTREYTPIPFMKTFLQRALWIRELLLDIEQIERYEASEVYPMRGESCFSFGRECEYFNTCQLSTQYLTKPCTPEEEDKTDYQVVLGLEDLLDSQLRKVEV
jgi:PD-(D/E)XK nuclease superfamily